MEIEDDATRFVRLFMMHERRLRSFAFTLLGNRDATDDVMQEISAVLWKKFGQLEDDDCFLKWGYVIARFEVLMHRRRLARDRFVLDEELINRLSDEFVADELENADRSEQLRKSLDGCLRSLRDPDRQIILTAYASGTKIVSLAEQMNVTSGSLYKWLGRIRRRLQQLSVEMRLPSEARYLLIGLYVADVYTARKHGSSPPAVEFKGQFADDVRVTLRRASDRD